jgi:DNA-directed RNA polymerase specialized sigma24 family protein
MAHARYETDLQDAATNLRVARDEFARAVVRANASGMSLRQIAAAAGISHETVRRLVRDAA